MRLLVLCNKLRERVQKTQAMCIGWGCMIVCCSHVVRLAVPPAVEVQHKLNW